MYNNIIFLLLYFIVSSIKNGFCYHSTILLTNSFSQLLIVVTLRMSSHTVGLVQKLIELQVCIESTDVQCCEVVLGVFLNQSLTLDHHMEDVELASFWDVFGECFAHLGHSFTLQIPFASHY